MITYWNNFKNIYDLGPELFSQKWMERQVRHAVRKAKKKIGILFKEVQHLDGHLTEEEIPNSIPQVEKVQESDSSDDENSILYKYKHAKKDFGTWRVNREINLANGVTKDDTTNIISMKRVIVSYIAILKKQFKSRIPKSIVKFLIKDSIKEVRGFLFSEFIKYENKVKLAQEDPHVMLEREQTINNMEALKKAKRALRSVKNSVKC